MKKYLLMALIPALILTACGVEEVGFATLETARKQANDNSLLNAKTWRSQSPSFAALSIIANGDSSQKPTCPQGDGWASIDLINANGEKVVSLKCSTVSRAVGCRTEAQFRVSQYTSDDGWCQNISKVPFPLPKIAE